MSRRFSRRRFLKVSAAVAGGVIAAGPVIVRACAAGESPNEKLDIAVIGVAGRGGDNLGGVSTENIVALCDVDEQRLGGAAKRFPGAKTFTDFRRMLDEVGKQVQASGDEDGQPGQQRRQSGRAGEKREEREGGCAEHRAVPAAPRRPVVRLRLPSPCGAASPPMLPLL